MSTGTIYPYPVIDQPFYNSTAATIEAGMIVQAAAAPVELKSTIDPYATTRGPLEAEGTTTVIPIQKAASSTSDGNAAAVGCALAEIKPSEWGVVRVYGPCLAKCTESLSDNHLTAYGVDVGVDGSLAEITASASKYTVAFQVGASGTTAVGDKRKVFMLGQPGSVGHRLRVWHLRLIFVAAMGGIWKV